MTQAKWTRPAWHGPTARAFMQARLALSDAQHAGDVTLAAAILFSVALDLTRDDEFWCRERPALGISRFTAATHTNNALEKTA